MEPKVLFEFTIEDINLILKGLAELPAKDSMNMIGRMQQEANKQLNPQDERAE